MKPLRQGHLDCLCGLYSIINAIKTAHPNSRYFSKEDELALYRQLVEHLENKGILGAALTEGLSSHDLSRLLNQTRSWLSQEHGLLLERRKPFHSQPSISFKQLIDALTKHTAQSNAAVIINIENRHFNHWTVVQYVTSKRLVVMDSDGHHWFRLSNCSTEGKEEAPRTHQIWPQFVYLITLRPG